MDALFGALVGNVSFIRLGGVQNRGVRRMSKEERVVESKWRELHGAVEREN